MTETKIDIAYKIELKKEDSTFKDYVKLLMLKEELTEEDLKLAIVALKCPGEFGLFEDCKVIKGKVIDLDKRECKDHHKCWEYKKKERK